MFKIYNAIYPPTHNIIYCLLTAYHKWCNPFFSHLWFTYGKHCSEDKVNSITKFWVNRPRWSEIADYEPIFTHNASAITPAKKSSINTNRLIGSPLCTFQWAQDKHCMLSLSPQREAQKRKVSKIWTISCN